MRKLIYRFHNPNTATETADRLLTIFIDVTKEKVQRAVQNAVNQPYSIEDHSNEEHSA